ncbi:glycosyltransferase 8 domain-containing protein 2-like isoform X2 [Pecten maximus]|uniref:glycosyltransferase 8 domain-containing protein 2-like isoform X2 n=1 Tax=Pecten maximus TaxID=6579 RepID=UPI001458B32B|nr:glycosyltransferase 8 domain-containing protein 2-like isoform X2 [Pecten maximus]
MECDGPTRRYLAAVLTLVWLGFMIYLWLPQILPNTRDKNLIEKGIFRQEAIEQKKNVNLSDAVHVCIMSDSNTIGGMMALVNSIRLNTKHNIMFHLFVARKCIDQARLWVETSKLLQIHYELRIFPEELVKGKIKVRGGRPELASPLNFGRYYLPQLLPKIHGRVLYIDDDSIVQDDVYELYNMKMKEGHAAAFSKDCAGPAKRLSLMKNNYADYLDFKNSHIQKLDLKPTECAFNTGVFVAELDLWRKYNITKQLEYWLTLNTKEEVYGNERGGGASQPPMMIVFYDKYTEIDPNWHVRYLGWTTRTSYSKSFLSYAHLLHWNGRFKPWGRVSSHSDIWDKYYVPDPSGKFHPVRKN